MDYMLLPLRRFADFNGRSRRKEYWMWVLFVLVGIFVLTLLDSALGLGGSTSSYADFENGASAGFNGTGGALSTIFSLLVFIPGLAVSIRRLHDIGKSGWWLLLAFVPLVGAIVLIVFYCMQGSRGPNRFGPDLKGGAPDRVFA